MQSATHTSLVSTKTLWIGHILSTLAVLFLTVDAGTKVMQLAPAMEATTQLGYPAGAVLGIGIVELACLVLYVFPPTSLLGAILLTGYLGGAVATHVRAGSEPFSVFFPIMIGALVWGGLYLRDDRLRALIPLRTPPSP